MTIANLVYAACALTSVLCAVLLMRGYARTRQPLLFWSAICFSGFALGNIMLVIDLAVMTQTDLILFRTVPIFLGMGGLVIGLVGGAK